MNEKTTRIVSRVSHKHVSQINNYGYEPINYYFIQYYLIDFIISSIDTRELLQVLLIRFSHFCNN